MSNEQMQFCSMNEKGDCTNEQIQFCSMNQKGDFTNDQNKYFVQDELKGQISKYSFVG